MTRSQARKSSCLDKDFFAAALHHTAWPNESPSISDIVWTKLIKHILCSASQCHPVPHRSLVGDHTEWASWAACVKAKTRHTYTRHSYTRTVIPPQVHLHRHRKSPSPPQVLGIEPRTLCMQGKNSTTVLQPQPDTSTSYKLSNAKQSRNISFAQTQHILRLANNCWGKVWHVSKMEIRSSG